MDLGVQLVALDSDHEEIFLLALFDYLEQIVCELLAHENSSFDVILIDEILLAKQGFVLHSDILMQKVDLGQVVGSEQAVIDWPFTSKEYASTANRQETGEYFLQIALAVALLRHC